MKYRKKIAAMTFIFLSSLLHASENSQILPYDFLPYDFKNYSVFQSSYNDLFPVEIPVEIEESIIEKTCDLKKQNIREVLELRLVCARVNEIIETNNNIRRFIIQSSINLIQSRTNLNLPIYQYLQSFCQNKIECPTINDIKPLISTPMTYMVWLGLVCVGVKIAPERNDVFTNALSSGFAQLLSECFGCFLRNRLQLARINPIMGSMDVFSETYRTLLKLYHINKNNGYIINQYIKIKDIQTKSPFLGSLISAMIPVVMFHPDSNITKEIQKQLTQDNFFYIVNIGCENITCCLHKLLKMHDAQDRELGTIKIIGIKAVQKNSNIMPPDIIIDIHLKKNFSEQDRESYKDIHQIIIDHLNDISGIKKENMYLWIHRDPTEPNEDGYTEEAIQFILEEIMYLGTKLPQLKCNLTQLDGWRYCQKNTVERLKNIFFNNGSDIITH